MSILNDIWNRIVRRTDRQKVTATEAAGTENRVYAVATEEGVMLFSDTPKGRKSFIYMWERQNQCCPLCGKPITKDTPWRTVMLNIDGISKLHLAHETAV